MHVCKGRGTADGSRATVQSGTHLLVQSTRTLQVLLHVLQHTQTTQRFHIPLCLSRMQHASSTSFSMYLAKKFFRKLSHIVKVQVSRMMAISRCGHQLLGTMRLITRLNAQRPETTPDRRFETAASKFRKTMQRSITQQHPFAQQPRPYGCARRQQVRVREANHLQVAHFVECHRRGMDHLRPITLCLAYHTSACWHTSTGFTEDSLSSPWHHISC